MATSVLAFALPQVADTSSESHAMSPTLKSPAIIACGCLRIHLVCSSVRLLVVDRKSPGIVSAIVEVGWNSIHIHCPYLSHSPL